MATLAELRKKPEASLTKAEKIQLFGDPGPPVFTMYARKNVDGRDVIVSRVFAAGDEPGEGWVDSPAKLGARESAPAAIINGVDIRETVVDEAPVPPEPESTPSRPRRGRAEE